MAARTEEATAPESAKLGAEGKVVVVGQSDVIAGAPTRAAAPGLTAYLVSLPQLD